MIIKCRRCQTRRTLEEAVQQDWKYKEGQGHNYFLCATCRPTGTWLGVLYAQVYGWELEELRKTYGVPA